MLINTVRVISPRTINENIERMQDMRNTYNILVGNLEHKRPLGIDGRKILKCMLEQNVNTWTK
jgi:hypothetical protein